MLYPTTVLTLLARMLFRNKKGTDNPAAKDGGRFIFHQGMLGLGLVVLEYDHEISRRGMGSGQ